MLRSNAGVLLYSSAAHLLSSCSVPNVSMGDITN